MEETILSLFELNALVRKSIQACMPDTYWVQAELSDVRIHYSGHCYLEFVQKEAANNAPVAKARGMIWANTYTQICTRFEQETGQAFVSGIKVLVKVAVTFHELYGYSLSVLDVDPSYTLGDMARKRRQILQRLQSEGVLTLNKELRLPPMTQRIAVISSATAAGYEDFYNQLYNNAFRLAFQVKLFPAIMQGEHVESSILKALYRINDERDQWDAVVIIRGGGAVSDLAGFDTYNLAAGCAQFPLPVITGIGHERDDTVLDVVAHTRVKTPTAAAEFLIAHQRRAAEHLDDLISYFFYSLPQKLERQKALLKHCSFRIPAAVHERFQQEHFRTYDISSRLQTACRSRLLKEKYRLRFEPRLSVALQAGLLKQQHRLDVLQQQLSLASPENLLRKGYSLTLLNGRIIKDAAGLKPGDEVVTKVYKGEFKSKIL